MTALRDTKRNRTCWAIVDKRGHLTVRDYRAPVYWRRKVAVAACWPDERVVPVEIVARRTR